MAGTCLSLHGFPLFLSLFLLSHSASSVKMVMNGRRAGGRGMTGGGAKRTDCRKMESMREQTNVGGNL